MFCLACKTVVSVLDHIKYICKEYLLDNLIGRLRITLAEILRGGLGIALGGRLRLCLSNQQCFPSSWQSALALQLSVSVTLGFCLYIRLVAAHKHTQDRSQ